MEHHRIMNLNIGERPNFRWSIVLAVALLAGVSARGAALLQESPGPNITSANVGATVGISFTVGGQNLSVTSLGYYDDGLDGFEDSHEVGIWNSSETLLGSVTVPSGTSGTLSGSYRYQALGSALTLSSGQTYTIGAYMGLNNDGTGTGPVLALDAAATYQSSLFTLGAFSLPTSTMTDAFFAANMQFTPVPEPAEWAALAGIGLLGFGIWRRSRRAVPAAA